MIPREELNRMQLEAGFYVLGPNGERTVERFAALVEARATAAERDACRAECQTMADILREHRDVEGAELAESLVEAIAARGAA